MGKLREWMNNNSAVVTVAAVLLLFVALFAIIKTNFTSRQARIVDVYFFDLGAKVTNPLDALYAAKGTEFPPIDSPSGQNMGVLAHVFGCGDCSAANKFIGYLQTYTPDGKRKLLESQKSGADMEFDDSAYVLVATTEKPQDTKNWVLMVTEKGNKLMESATTKCPQGKTLVPCLP